MSIRQLILNIDNAAGRFLSFKLAAYIKEQILIDGAGPYTREEWAKARALGYREAGLGSSDLDEDKKYLGRMFQVQYRNFLSAQRLCKVLDFRKYDSVLELGCGEMVQAFVITQRYPHLQYCASDVDAYVIDKCLQLPLLRSIEKRIIDVSNLKSNDLRDVQLVLSWELTYALDDEKLIHLFSVLGDAKVSMMICTTQLTGLLRSVTRRLKRIPRRGEGIVQGGLRMHGWHHSLGYYNHLARQFGLRLNKVWYPTQDCGELDNFTFILFSPKS